MPKTSNSDQRDALFHFDDDLPTIHAMNGAQGKVENSVIFKTLTSLDMSEVDTVWT